MFKLKNVLESQNTHICYLDMDGVLCDFDKQFKRFLANDVLFKNVVDHKKAISQKKLTDRNMTREDFVQKALDIRKKVLSADPKDAFEMFKVRTREQLGVPLSWRYIMASRETFWATMDWMPGGKDLVKAVSNTSLRVEILTAGAGEYAKNGKQEWLQKNGLGHLPFNIVDKGVDKGMFGETGDILIDDKKENIDGFVDVGGTGIFHTDTPTSIKKLKNILSKNG